MRAGRPRSQWPCSPTQTFCAPTNNPGKELAKKRRALFAAGVARMAQTHLQ